MSSFSTLFFETALSKRLESQLKANIKIVSYVTPQSLIITFLKNQFVKDPYDGSLLVCHSVLYLVYMHGIYHVICFVLARVVSIYDCWTNKYACLTVTFGPPCLVSTYLCS